MRAGPAVLLAAFLAGCADRGQGMRAWEGCLERTEPAPAVRACGRITLRGGIRDTANFVVQVRHTVPLERLKVQSGPAVPREGFVNQADALWRIHLGTGQPGPPDQVAEEMDTGAFDLLLQSRGDSLSGAWSRACLGRCPERGTARFRRIAP